LPPASTAAAEILHLVPLKQMREQDREMAAELSPIFLARELEFIGYVLLIEERRAMTA